MSDLSSPFLGGVDLPPDNGADTHADSPDEPDVPPPPFRGADDPLAQFARPGNEGGAMGLFGTGNPDPLPSGLRRPRSQSTYEDHTELVGRITRRRRLNPDAAQELHSFSQELLVPQLLSVYGVMLELLEHVTTQNAPSRYEIPDELKKLLKTYSTAMILSPKSSSYLKGNVECVIAALRLRGITLLPDASDTARLDIIKSYVTTCLTDKRCKLKAAIQTIARTGDAPADEPAPVPASANGRTKKPIVYKKMDIGKLCSTIIAKMATSKSSTKVCITLAMYHRMAYLRRCVAKFGTEDNFWNQVDKRLEQARRKYTTPAAYDKYFKDCYLDDVRQHGDPNHGGYVLESVLESWQVAVQNESVHAASQSTSTTQAPGSQSAPASGPPAPPPPPPTQQQQPSN